MRGAELSKAPTMMPVPAGLSAGDLSRRVDPWMVGAALLLVTVGIAAVYSGSAVRASERFGGPTFFLLGHLSALAMGLVLMVWVVRTPLESWSRMAYPILGLAFVLLVLTVTTAWGQSANGAVRWLKIGYLRFQPAELAKLAVVVYLAHSLARKRERVSGFAVGFLPHVLVVSALVALILKQPDFGTSAVIYATLGVMLFVAGTRAAYLVLAVIAAVPVAWAYVARHPHAWKRIQVFLAPESDPAGSSYHVYQSLLAFGSGGPFGLGLGQGSQKLFFLPEPHTDFIFATIGQELGFFGASLVLIAFGVLVGRSLRVANRLPCRFPMFLTFGVAAWLGLQACINMAVVVALLPTKGLTLPLISFGRSSMIICLVGVGILLRASAEEVAHREMARSRTRPRKRRGG